MFRQARLRRVIEATAVEALQRHYDAFNRGDLDAVMQELDDAIVFADQSSELGDTYAGQAAVRKFFRPLMTTEAAGFAQMRTETGDFTHGRDRLLIPICMRMASPASGAGLEFHAFHVWTVERDRLVRLDMFREADAALAAAGLESAD
jgi:ketosteroid isomerase-like protein